MSRSREARALILALGDALERVTTTVVRTASETLPEDSSEDLEELLQLRSSNAQLTEVLDERQRQLSVAETENQSLASEVDRLRGRLLECEQAREDAETDLSALRLEFDSCRHELTVTSAALQRRTHSVRGLQRRLARSPSPDREVAHADRSHSPPPKPAILDELETVDGAIDSLQRRLRRALDQRQ
eukprot:gnl/Ergobibamus_cyprinoides/3755.p2 GENE.gnl/Ergobibamus_cyprinoides/3755~~gnl/Ergobibamus_cyprinoides/3755.p2  ORF type:complete len:187 (-),score=17.59 gnl/Ergobibamus_cyprinoides/3755:17-577(-)